MVFIDDGDRGVMKFLGIAPRLQDDGQRKSVSHQSQKNQIVQKTTQFLDAKPVDVCSFAHRRALAFLVAKQQNADQGEDWNKDDESQQVPAEVRKAQSLGE